MDCLADKRLGWSGKTVPGQGLDRYTVVSQVGRVELAILTCPGIVAQLGRQGLASTPVHLVWVHRNSLLLRH